MNGFRAKSAGTERDKKREATRSRLLDAARTLFGERGIDHVSVNEIGKAAGVSPSLINAYFGGKVGLLYTLVREANTPQLEETRKIAKHPDPARDRLVAILRCWAGHDLADRNLLSLLQAFSWSWSKDVEAENRADLAPFLALLAMVLRDGTNDGSFRTKIDPDATAQVIFAAYTWHLRAATFDDVAIDEFVHRLQSQIVPLLDP